MNYPKAVWPYSPYYKAWNTLYCSGQIGLIPESGKIIEWWIEEETKQVISNISWVLKENWLDFKDVVKTTIYLDNMNDFWKVNEIYWEYFSHKPARSTVAVKTLPLWALVEIEVLAVFK
jgi:2-iminobutanoate/2-iminopropanoate deaminase